jgi:transcriptional regulator with XRE-family HTH domain
MSDRDQINKAIGAELRRQRHLFKMSQLDLGMAMGVSYQQVQKYETGKNGLSMAMVVKIAKNTPFAVGQVLRAGLDA